MHLSQATMLQLLDHAGPGSRNIILTAEVVGHIGGMFIASDLRSFKIHASHCIPPWRQITFELNRTEMLNMDRVHIIPFLISTAHQSKFNAQSHCQSFSRIASLLSPIKSGKSSRRRSGDISINLERALISFSTSSGVLTLSLRLGMSRSCLKTVNITCAAYGFNPTRRRNISQQVSFSIASI